MSQLLALSPWWCFVTDDGAYLQITLVSYAEGSRSSSSSGGGEIKPPVLRSGFCMFTPTLWCLSHTPPLHTTTPLPVSPALTRKRQMWFSLESVFMLWNTELHRASCCSSESKSASSLQNEAREGDLCWWPSCSTTAALKTYETSRTAAAPEKWSYVITECNIVNSLRK